MLNALIVKQLEEIEKILAILEMIESQEGKYQELDTFEIHCLERKYKDFIEDIEIEIEKYRELLSSKELLDDIEYLIDIHKLQERQITSILFCCNHLKEFENSGIDIKRYDELQKRLEKNAEELNDFCQEKVFVSLPYKPEESLNFLMSDLEEQGLNNEAIENIVKAIGNRSRIPKGQKQRREFDKFMKRSQEKFRENIEYLGNGLIRFGKGKKES